MPPEGKVSGGLGVPPGGIVLTPLGAALPLLGFLPLGEPVQDSQENQQRGHSTHYQRRVQTHCGQLPSGSRADWRHRTAGAHARPILGTRQGRTISVA